MRRAAMKAMLLTVLAFLAALVLGAGLAGATDEFDQYRLESVSASLTSTQAGAHADLTTTFKLSQKEEVPYAQTRDIMVKVPPGMIGNPQGIPRCSVQDLGNLPEESECPIAAQVGVTEVTVGGRTNGTFTEPIYNMEPPAGDIVARFGFFAVGWPAFINVRIDPTDLGLIATIEGAPSAAGLLEAKTTLWGVPAASIHDGERMTPLEARNSETPPSREAGIPEAPFLSNPTDCSLQRQITVTARSYQRPDAPSTMSAPFPQITGCQALQFSPRFSLVPTNPEAAAPTGVEADLEIPQNESPQGRATSTLKSAVVTLPEGLTINPAAGTGLEACSSDQVGFGTNEDAHCPDAAKIGSADIDVPALEHIVHGSVYQRTPEPGHLFRFWLVADEQGVHLKLPAEIQGNPLTGQVTTLFLGLPSLGGNPQVPVEDLKLHVFGGPRAPLSTPAQCGTYQTHFQFTPWSGNAPTEGNTAMHITSGCGKGGFSPQLSAGMQGASAGSFAPFVFTLTRNDGEANPQSIAVHLPQGLLAKLGGVDLCSDADAATGTCSASSKIGRLTAAAGVGGAPLWIPQPGKAPTAAYLAGPYKGAPYSVVSVVPAQAGPFDLGLVVNRAAIYVDPETTLATIKTDPLPQILEGVPVSYRTLHVEVDRNEFTLYPTSCAAKTITATVTATNGAVAEPQAGFQATNCSSLSYSPKLKLSFKGSTKRTGNPAVHAVLTQKPGQANTKAAIVLLPQGEFIDNAHINNPCTRVQFNEGACPAASILGHVQAVSPLLSQPLSGPVYFRSNGGARELPDIVADLHGQIHITLVGFIDSVKTGKETSRVRTRFLNVPDAPVTKFTLNFFGGKKGLIENSLDLCRHKRRASLEFRAQNGKKKVSNPFIATKCKKKD
jgi:hypothetical protein